MTRSHDSPFDYIASSYDETFTNTVVGRYQRMVTIEIMKRRFQAGMRVLEIGCGTGVDTVFLARRGLSVTAIDASPRMIEITRQRVEAAGVQNRVNARVCSAERLADEPLDEPFDGILSNFGVLNCLSTPETTGTIVARYLRPEGCAVLCLLGRWCAWEILVHVAQCRVGTAFRRLNRGGADVRVGDGYVHVVYPSPREVIDACTPHCTHVGTTGVGVLVPPSYLEPLVRRFPRIFRTFRGIEPHVNHKWPCNRLGDHYCLELQRRRTASITGAAQTL